MSTYTVNVERDETMWRVTVPEIARITVARNLAEVEFMARDLIALMTDQEPDAFAVNIHIESPVREIVEQATEHRAQADELNRLAAVEIRTAAEQLRTQGITARDTAQVLGVSPQRVSQLLSASGGKVATGKSGGKAGTGRTGGGKGLAGKGAAKGGGKGLAGRTVSKKGKKVA